MIYLTRGLAEIGHATLGRVLSVVFAVMCIGASFGARYQAAYETIPHDLQLESIRSQLKRMGQ